MAPDQDDATTTLPSEPPALEGVFGVDVGEKVLMHIFSEGISGRLLVVGQGPTAPRAMLPPTPPEPVHVEPCDGAQAFAKKLDEYKGIPPVASVRGTVTGLARSGVPPLRLLEALRDLNRDFTRALLACESGRFELYVEDRPLDDVPLVAVNPFGLVLEARRKRTPPDVLHRIGEELASSGLAARPGLAGITARIRSFTSGIDLAAVIDGTRTAAQVYEQTSLPPSIGGLVISTLVHAGLVELLKAPRMTARRDTWIAQETTLPMTLSDDALSVAELQRLPGEAQELLSLYLELKPARTPAQIFGDDVEGNPAGLERAWEERLALLDPRLIKFGPARPYLLARVEELRAKLERAHQALASNATRPASSAFMLFERIGSGGMAEVYRAKATENGAVVAVKRIRAENRDDPDFVRDLLHEARLAKRVRHPNVVRVLTAGKNGDELYLAMELVDGADLHALLRKAKAASRPVPIDLIVRIVADACGGLQAAHAARDDHGEPEPILHRDVSPQNILVGLDGVAKITDFGIARTIPRPSLSGETVPHDPKAPLKGKLAYLAPELIDGGPATVRTDVYAMGMTLYATLTKLPFLRESPFETLLAILREDLVPPSTSRIDVPAAIDAIVLRACAKRPEQRYASAQELQLVLEEWLARRPPIDVGAWVRSLLGRSVPIMTQAHEEATRTVPIFESLS